MSDVGSKYKFLFIGFCLQAFTLSAQVDTVQEKLNFDFGFTRSRNINLWPLFKQVSTQSYKELDILFPLFLKKKDETRSFTYSHLLPLYFKSKSPAHTDFRFASLYYPSLFHYTKDSNNVKSFRLLEILPRFSLMDIRKSRRGIYLDQNLLFFIWFKNDIQLQQSHFVIFPFSWYYRNGSNKSYTLLPLFSTGNKEENRFTVITPLFWHFRNQKTLSNTLFPLFSSGHSDDKKQSHLVISPLYWQYKTETEKNNVLLPLWWRNESYSGLDTTITNVIFPVSWNIKSKGRHSYTFFPLFSVGQYPKSSYFAITPFYWNRTHKQGHSRTIFPIFWNNTRYENKDTLKSNIVFPLLWDFSSKFYHYSMLLPIYGKFQDQSYQSTTVMPLFSTGFSSDGKRNHFALSPLFWYVRNPVATTKLFLPLFYNRKNHSADDSTRTTMAALLWWSVIHNRENYSHVLFPVYWSAIHGQHKVKTLFPLIWSRVSPEYRSFTLFPIFWYKRSDELKYHSLLPFYFYSSSPNTRNFQFLLLVYNYRKNKDQSIYHGLLWKTIYWNKYADGSHEFRFLYLLLADVKKKDLVEKSYFPLYYYSKTKNTDITKAWFLYFYSRSTHYIPEIKDYYIEERIFWFMRIRSNYNQLLREGKAGFIKHRRHPKTEMPSGRN